LESLHQDYKRQSLLGINQGVFNRVLTVLRNRQQKHTANLLGAGQEKNRTT